MKAYPDERTAAKGIVGQGGKFILRPEARPLYWHYMDGGQKQAFAKIVEGLREAVEGLDTHLGHHPTSGRSFFEINQSRGNQTLWLSGERGTGKTSLLMSVALAIVRPEQWKQGKPANPSKETLPASMTRMLDKVHKRIIWLEPLEMELLPGPSNLLAAILTRIEAIADRMGVASNARSSSSYRGLLDPHADVENAIIELRKLMADVTVAWEGNLPARGEHLDPDSFASEVMRAERARLRIPERFTHVLDSLAMKSNWGGRVENPLFVLPVDDFDLNPTRCVELLRLIRMLQLPRLFTLILGDITSAARVFQIKLTGDFAKVADIRLHADILDLPLHLRNKQLSYDALRKLIPPAQRVVLGHMTVDEALAYRPFATEDSLEQILSKFAIELPHWSPLNIHDALGFLTDDLLWHNDKDLNASTTDFPLERSIYSVLTLFRAPPRFVVDIWYRLRQTLEESTRDVNCNGQSDDHTTGEEVAGTDRVSTRERDAQQGKPQPRLQDIVNLFYDAVDADPNLNYDDQAILHQLFDCHHNHDRPYWNIKGEYVSVSFIASESNRIRSPKPKTASEFRMQTRRTWRIVPRIKSAPDDHRVDDRGRGVRLHLSDSTAALLILSHDLITSTSRRVHRVGLAPKSIPLAATIWRLGFAQEVQIAWLTPPLVTFREWDALTDGWDRLNRVTRQRKPGSGPALADGDDERIAFLGFWWMRQATALLSLARLNCPETMLLTQKNWNALGGEISALLEMVEKRTPEQLSQSRRRVAEAWLTRLAIVIAPESGIAPFISSRALAPVAQELSDYWCERQQYIRLMRACVAADFRKRNAMALGDRLTRPLQSMPQWHEKLQAAASMLLSCLAVAEGSFMNWLADSRRSTPALDQIVAKVKKSSHAWSPADIGGLRMAIETVQDWLATLPEDPGIGSKRAPKKRGTAMRSMAQYQGPTAADLSAQLKQLDEIAEWMLFADNPINLLQDGCLCPSEAEIDACQTRAISEVLEEYDVSY